MEKLKEILSKKFKTYEFSVEEGLSHYSVGLAGGIGIEDIELIEKVCKLKFISVTPFSKFSGASWIILYFIKN